MKIKKELSHFISFLEKWTELDILYYLKGGMVLFSTQFLLLLSSFGLSIGFAYLSSKEAFGQFQFIIAIISTLAVLTVPGANIAAFIGVSQKKEGTIWQGIKLKLKSSILSIAGLLAVAAYFYFKQDTGYKAVWQALLVAIIFFPILYTLDITTAFFGGRKKFEWGCFFQLLRDSGGAIAVLVALFFTRNLVALIAIYLLIQTLGYILAFLFVRKKIQNSKKDPEFNSYSIHFTVINFVTYIKLYFDKIIITYFLGFVATATYTIAAAMAEQLYAVSKSISNLSFPKMAVHRKEKLYYEVKRRMTKLVMFFVLVAVVGIFAAPFIIPFFFSQQYKDAVPIAQLLLLIVIPRAIAAVLARVQEAQRQKKKLYIINTTYASAEIVFLLILTPLYGIYGVVGAKAIANAIYLIFAWKSLD